MKNKKQANDNPILSFRHHQKYDNFELKHVKESIKEATKNGNDLLDLLMRDDLDLDIFLNVINKYGYDEHVLNHQLDYLREIDKNWYKSYQKYHGIESKDIDERKIRKNLSNLLKRHKNLSYEQKSVIKQIIKEIDNYGGNLRSNKKYKIWSIKKQLSDLSFEFENNYYKSLDNQIFYVAKNDMIELINITSPDDVKNNSNKKCTLTTSYADLLRDSTSPELRKKIYTQIYSIASDLNGNKYNNLNVIEKMIKLRHKYANEIGFKNYTDLILSDNMLKNKKDVSKFLKNEHERTVKKHSDKIVELKEFTKNELGIDEFNNWDIPFILKNFIGSNSENISNEFDHYFPFKKVLNNTCDCIGKLFDIKFSNIKKSNFKEDIFYVDVIDKKNDKIGRIYLDLIYRKEKSIDSDVSYIVPRIEIDGIIQKPVANLKLSLNKNKSGKIYFDFDDLCHFLHEFGHALHCVLTQVDKYSISGYLGGENDCGEVTSMFMEKFLFNFEFIKKISCHHKTGEQIPRHIFYNEIRINEYYAPFDEINNIKKAMFDLEIHSGNPNSILKIYNTIDEKYGLANDVKFLRKPCQFLSVFADGYESNYYSYLLSDRIAAQAFELYENKSSIFNKKLGKRFKDEIFATGASRPFTESFKAFTGFDFKI